MFFNPPHCCKWVFDGQSLNRKKNIVTYIYFVTLIFFTGDSLSTMKTSGEFDSSKDTSHYSTLEGDLDDSFFSR